MQILIAGTGGVGGYFGAQLARAGNKVSFLARGQQLEALRTKGLTVKSYLGDFHLPKVSAADHPADLPTPDWVLLCTKSWQLTEVAGRIYQHCHDKTTFLPLQNGADNYEKLIRVVPKNQAVAGLCKIISYIESPGVISHPFFEPEIVFGEADNSRSSRVKALQQLFAESGVRATIPENIMLAVWLKFLYICTVSGLGALTRVPIGQLRADPFLRQMLLDTAHEIVAVGRAKGIPIEDKHLHAVFSVIDAQEPNVTASMQRDLMEGKPSELEEFNGYVSRQGKALQVPTPVNDYIYHCLKPQEILARKNNINSISTF